MARAPEYYALPPPAAPDLPIDVLIGIFQNLNVQDVVSAGRTCKAWQAVAEQEGAWVALLHRDYPAADAATVAVLLRRAQCTTENNCCPSKQAYRALSQRWTCDRCQQVFTDAANAATSCSFHPGILFSGGLMNGAGLRYTCCNRRAHHIPNGSRDANGCTHSFHCGGLSAWQRNPSGVKPRELPPLHQPSGGGGSSSSQPAQAAAPSTRSNGGSSSGGGSGSPPRTSTYPFINTSKELQEWHPNQRPGLLELPSRLFFSSN